MNQRPSRAAGAHRVGMKQRRVQPRKRLWHRLDIQRWRSGQRRVTVRKLIAHKGRYRGECLSFIFAADKQLAGVALQGIAADNRQRAFGISAGPAAQVPPLNR